MAGSYLCSVVLLELYWMQVYTDVRRNVEADIPNLFVSSAEFSNLSEEAAARRRSADISGGASDRRGIPSDLPTRFVGVCVCGGWVCVCVCVCVCVVGGCFGGEARDFIVHMSLHPLPLLMCLPVGSCWPLCVTLKHAHTHHTHTCLRPSNNCRAGPRFAAAGGATRRTGRTFATSHR